MEDQVVADGDYVFVHVFEVAGDGDLFDGVGDLAVFDPIHLVHPPGHDAAIFSKFPAIADGVVEVK